MSNAVNGLPARYHATLPTLADGEGSPIMVDSRGRVIISPTSVSSGQVYTVTDATPSRTFDAGSVNVTQLANVVAAIIADLQSVKILS